MMATETVTQTKEAVTVPIRYLDDPGHPLEAAEVSDAGAKNEPPRLERPMVIRDVSENMEHFTFDKQGFQYVKHELKVADDFDWEDKELIQKELYPIMGELCKETLKNVKGLPPVTDTIYMGHVVRYSQRKDDTRRQPRTAPITNVHIDVPLEDAPKFIRPLLRDRADELLGKRFMIINMWRPIRPVTRDPLAVCDASSVSPSDLVVLPLRFPTHSITSIEVKPNPEHRWYFKRNQQPNEVILFKQFDSCGMDGNPRQVPHCSFKDPLLAEGEGEPRTSIEFRIVVFFDDVVA